MDDVEPTNAKIRWQEHAECRKRGTDPDVFFPGRGERPPDSVLAVCLFACPVRAECLSLGVAAGGDDGWWGGVPLRRHLRQLRITADRAA